MTHSSRSSPVRWLHVGVVSISAMLGTSANAQPTGDSHQPGQANTPIEFIANRINMGAKLKYNLTADGSELDSHQSSVTLQLRIKQAEGVRVIQCEEAQATLVQTLSGDSLPALPSDQKRFTHDWAKLHLEEHTKLRQRQEYKADTTFRQYPVVPLPIPHQGDVSALRVQGHVQVTYTTTSPVPLKVQLQPELYGKRLRIAQIPEFFVILHPPGTNFSNWHITLEIPAKWQHHLWGIRFLDKEGKPMEYNSSNSQFPEGPDQTLQWNFTVIMRDGPCEAIELELLPDLQTQQVPFVIDPLRLQPTQTNWDAPFQPRREKPKEIPVEIKLKSTPPTVDGKAVTHAPLELAQPGRVS